jgi:penicillin-binding protein 2
MLILSVLLLGRLFYLQIIKTDYYQLRAENNRINVSPVLPNRGLVYDKNGHVLAKNYSSYAKAYQEEREHHAQKRPIKRFSELIFNT